MYGNGETGGRNCSIPSARRNRAPGVVVDERGRRRTSGKHRSTHKGGCFELAEQPAYSAGDEIRLIDWRVYAKSDRFYIKQFEEETNLQAVMVVDASGSMQYGHSTVSKLNYACMAVRLFIAIDAAALRRGRFERRLIKKCGNTSHPVRTPITCKPCSMRMRNEAGGMTSLAGNLHEVAQAHQTPRGWS